MARIALLFLALLAFAAPARADDVSASARSVVRVVVIAFEDGEVVDFMHGSGFAVGPNRIVTNAHVVEVAQQYPENVAIGIVPSEGQRSFGARLIAIDRSKDLALLEMQGGTLPTVPINVGAIAEGDDVVALGYPGNVDLATARSAEDYIRPLPPTRSEGNYSNERVIDGVHALLHTASIARGNSGGPLVDNCGRVVGVNTFITRGDEGDSPFAFAISTRELAAFLRAAGQRFATASNACESLEAMSARERAREEQEERARDQALEEQQREASAAREAAVAANEDRRETFLGIALFLGAFGLVAAGAGGILIVKDKMKPGYIVGGIGVALLVGSAIVFFSRPGRDDIAVGKADAAPKREEGRSFAGRNSCRLIEDRSRVTVSSTQDVTMRWSDTGCVNRRTQYSEDEGVWSRILVPNEEQTISVVEFRPDTGIYTVNRYLVGATVMERVREQRRGAVTQCTTDEEDLQRLSEQQGRIRNALPAAPNERLVYQCEAAAEEGE